MFVGINRPAIGDFEEVEEISDHGIWMPRSDREETTGLSILSTFEKPVN